MGSTTAPPPSKTCCCVTKTEISCSPYSRPDEGMATVVYDPKLQPNSPVGIGSLSKKISTLKPFSKLRRFVSFKKS